MALHKQQNQTYIQLKINNIECSIPKDYTILQACEYIGLEIPRFCYHKELLIAGNCRMCLIELENSPKPVASCAMQIMPGMSIFTDTPLVRKAREGVLEFLLLNHPLDCPICDQGGECDLQDQSLLYGSDRSRFYEFKRSVEDKNCGPLIKTIMTRCIHCTRCVRFIDEVAGAPVLGTTNRGNATEIGTYINLNIKSELSGNLIDLCPVGALTSKPYAFRARSWELKNKPTIDLFDGLGSNTVTNIRGAKIMRVLPGINAEVNREWISDKARFSFDAFDVQRLNTPLVKENTKFKAVNDWKIVFNTILNKIQNVKPNAFTVVGGNFINAETLFGTKALFNKCGIQNLIAEKSKINYNIDFSQNYVFKDSLTDFSNHDLCFIIGSNIKHEAPVLNSQLRKRYLAGNFEIYNLGSNYETNIPTFNVGLDLNDLIKIVEGSHNFSKVLAKAKNPLIIVSSNIYNQSNSKIVSALLNQLQVQLVKLNSNWNSLNILHGNSNDVNYLDLGFKNSTNINFDLKEVFVLMGTQDFLTKQNINIKDKFIIYIGHHGTNDAQKASIILPSFSFVEEAGIFTNTEGRSQFSEKLVKYELNHRSIWSIVQMLCQTYKPNLGLKFESFNALRMHFELNYPQTFNTKKINKLTSNYNINTTYNYTKIKPLNSFIENFYLNDTISQHSSIMGKCSSMLRTKQNFIN